MVHHREPVASCSLPEHDFVLIGEEEKVGLVGKLDGERHRATCRDPTLGAWVGFTAIPLNGKDQAKPRNLRLGAQLGNGVVGDRASNAAGRRIRLSRRSERSYRAGATLQLFSHGTMERNRKAAKMTRCTIP